MKELTKAEEQIMQVLWEMEKGFVKDVLEKLPSPLPAYNTVSTIIRILEKKGFVGYTAYGKSHEYYPLVSKDDYTRSYFRNFVSGYFSNSYKQMVSFFAKEQNLSLRELEEIKELMDKEIKRKKKK
ncbi:MAG: BlaI/MecI/CopY family transcriptional regulator [Bacteroidetes bacterium]|nr:BlaI/MecI/CopY family transcriptional regulator [Bacteroidota bacterium]MBU1718647.1 BlaI/MecI/CopY family transcriptional regulator [Bacteroidota bacterium]